jgi:hypothetical protein
MVVWSARNVVLTTNTYGCKISGPGDTHVSGFRKFACQFELTAVFLTRIVLCTHDLTISVPRIPATIKQHKIRIKSK